MQESRADNGDIIVLKNLEPERSAKKLMMMCLNLRTGLNNFFQRRRVCPCRDGHSLENQAPCRGSRMHYQQFDYSTDGTELTQSDTDQAELAAPAHTSHSSISIDEYLPQLFSDHERARSPSPQLTASEKISSLIDTSAPNRVLP